MTITPRWFLLQVLNYRMSSCLLICLLTGTMVHCLAFMNSSISILIHDTRNITGNVTWTENIQNAFWQVLCLGPLAHVHVMARWDLISHLNNTSCHTTYAQQKAWLLGSGIRSHLTITACQWRRIISLGSPCTGKLKGLPTASPAKLIISWLLALSPRTPSETQTSSSTLWDQGWQSADYHLGFWQH